MSWSWWLCDFRTGNKLLKVNPDAGPWSRELNAGPGGSHSFPVAAMAEDVRLAFLSASRPWANVLVQCWDDAPVYAGVITGRPYKYGRRMTLEHTDARNILKDRFPWGGATYRQFPTWVLIGRSWGSIAAHAIQESINSGPRVLPFEVSYSPDAGPHDQTIYGYHLTNTHDFVRDIQEREGGPDIDFRPRWSSLPGRENRLGFEVRIGSPSQPALGGAAVEFNMTTPDHGVTDLDVNENADKQYTDALVTGEGQEWGRLVGAATVGAEATIPQRVTVSAQPTETSQAVLDGNARAILDAHRYPTVQYSFAVLASKVSPVLLIPGSSVGFYFKDDVVLRDGWHRTRVLSISGDAGEKLTVQTQPVSGAVSPWRA